MWHRDRMATLTTDPFADYYGVVLTHEDSGPLLWSPLHRDWRLFTIEGVLSTG